MVEKISLAVNDVNLEIVEDTILLSSQASRQAISLPLSALPYLQACVNGVATKHLEQTLVTPGLDLLNTNNRNRSDLSDSEIMQETLEGMESGTSQRAARWWLAFLEENKTRPQLITRLMFELKARSMSIDEFFQAYVYSNTENIKANLHFADYLRTDRQELQAINPAGILKFLKDLFDIENQTDRVIGWWNDFEAARGLWDDRDLLAIMNLSQSLNATELLRLSALANSLKPRCLFNYLECLKLIPGTEWYCVVRGQHEAADSDLSGHRKLMEIFIDLYQGQDSDQLQQLTLKELLPAMQCLPIKLSGATAGAILDYLDVLSLDLTGQVLASICKALQFSITEKEIRRILLKKIESSTRY